MMNDLTGQRFGCRVATDRHEKRRRDVYWLCRCDCGLEKWIRGGCLVKGISHNCGCFRRSGFNGFVIKGDKAFLFLREGKKAIIDRVELPRCMGHHWVISNRRNTGYVHSRDSGRRWIYLHSFLTGWKMVDHINRDPMDNTIGNLREADRFTNAQNACLRRDNTSGLKGVTFIKRKQKWKARITVRHKEMFIGYFSTPEGAGRAYDSAVLENFPSGAYLNFPN